LEFGNLLYIVDNDIAIISFDRPNSLNSLNTETILTSKAGNDRTRQTKMSQPGSESHGLRALWRAANENAGMRTT
jgi:hypothetical protein